MQKIVIFGTGNAGRAIYRAFKDSKEHKIVAFIDNNKAMVGKDYKGIAIFSPKDYAKLEFDYIAYSGVWHEQMRAQLNELGVDENKIKHISEDKLVYTSDEREKAIDDVAKKLDEYFLAKNINYFLCGSAGINVLRGRALSYASDVDFYVLDYNDLLVIANDLPSVFSDLNVEITKFKKDDIVRKAGQIDRISITDDNEEKLIIDIGLYDDYGEYRLTDYDNKKFFYMSKRVFEAGTIRKKYKDFELNMLAKYDEYYTLIYGKNYIEIPKSWSESDYGNLASIDEINKFYLKK